MPDHIRPMPGNTTPPPLPHGERQTLAWQSTLELLAAAEQLLAQLQRILDASPSEVRALLQLWATDGLTAGELATRVRLTTAATTSMIDRLQHRGLVTRTKSPNDKRFVIIHMTDTAHDRLTSFGAYLQGRIDALQIDEPDEWNALSSGIGPTKALLLDTVKVMQLTPVETFPSHTEGLPIRTIELNDN